MSRISVRQHEAIDEAARELGVSETGTGRLLCHDGDVIWTIDDEDRGAQIAYAYGGSPTFRPFASGEDVDEAAAAFARLLPNVKASLYSKPVDLILVEESRQVVEAPPIGGDLRWSESWPARLAASRVVYSAGDRVVTLMLYDGRHLDAVVAASTGAGKKLEVSASALASADESSAWTAYVTSEEAFRAQVRALARFVQKRWGDFAGQPVLPG